MANNIIDWSNLDRFLQHDHALTQTLLDILVQERKALEQREYARFDELLIEKQQLVENLEQNTNARRQWLHNNGYDDEASALLAVRSQSKAIAKLWDQTAALWQDCQTANQINEQICRRTRVVVEGVLDILRGQQGQGATYNAKGYEQRAQNGRTITNA